MALTPQPARPTAIVVRASAPSARERILFTGLALQWPGMAAAELDADINGPSLRPAEGGRLDPD
jgi:hypothetical protein